MENKQQTDGGSPNNAPEPVVQPASAANTTISPQPLELVVGTTPISRATIENDQNKHKKLILIGSILAIVIVLLVAGGLGFYNWYSHQDHSIYSKLTSLNYGSNGYVFSLSYPSVLRPNTQEFNVLKQDTTSDAGPLVYYQYDINSTQRIGLSVAYFSGVEPLLNHVNITPSEAIAQIKAKSGSYVNLFNQFSPTAFDDLYGNCNQYLVNINNQRGLLCVRNISNGYISAIVIGIGHTNQYELSIIMPQSIWNAHQKVWQKVEKSFVYDQS